MRVTKLKSRPTGIEASIDKVDSDRNHIAVSFDFSLHVNVINF